MKRSVMETAGFVLRPVLPFLVAVLLVIIATIPYRFPGIPGIMPWLSLIAVYYWSMTRPDLMPIWAVFLVGILRDSILGGPLGVSALVLMTAHLMGATQRRALAGKPFLVGWTGFVVIALMAGGLSWLLSVFYFAAFVDPWPVFIQFLVTIVIYPVLWAVFRRLETTLRV